MGMKLNAAGLTVRLGKRYAGLVNPGVSHVEVGVADASIAPYATYVEYGWVQRVTGKQSLFLSNAIGKPVPRRDLWTTHPLSSGLPLFLIPELRAVSGNLRQPEVKCFAYK